MRIVFLLAVTLVGLAGFSTFQPKQSGLNGYVSLEFAGTIPQKRLPLMVFYTDTFGKLSLPIFAIQKYKVNDCELARIINEIEYSRESESIDTTLLGYFNYTIYDNDKVNRYCTSNPGQTMRLLSEISKQIEKPDLRTRFLDRIDEMAYYFH
jgi:hypothetical protein